VLADADVEGSGWASDPDKVPALAVLDWGKVPALMGGSRLPGLGTTGNIVLADLPFDFCSISVSDIDGNLVGGGGPAPSVSRPVLLSAINPLRCIACPLSACLSRSSLAASSNSAAAYIRCYSRIFIERWMSYLSFLDTLQFLYLSFLDTLQFRRLLFSHELQLCLQICPTSGFFRPYGLDL